VFLAVMAIAQLRMAPVMEPPTDQDLDVATGMVAPMDTAVGEALGMQGGALGGDILRTQLATRTHLAHRLQCMSSQFWLSQSCWQRKPSPQSGIFAHLPRSIFRM